MPLFLFVIMMIAMIFLDIKLRSGNITPLTIIGSVYTALICLNNIVSTRLFHNYPVEDSTLLSLFTCFFLIFVIDILFSAIQKNVCNISTKIDIHFQNYRLFSVLFCIGVLAYSLQFVRLFLTYGFNIKGQNNGILGHLSSLAFLLGPLVMDFAIKSRNRVQIFMVLMMNLLVVGISVLFGGKYVIFINTLYFLLFFLLKRNNKLIIGKIIRIGILLVIGAFGVFFVLYFIIPRMTGAYVSSFRFVVEHMSDYLLGSIVSNNYTIGNAGTGDPLIPFTVPINIVKALIRDSNYVSPLYVFSFPVRGDYITNVSGFIGETIYNLGFFRSYLYIGVIFVFINIIFLLYRTKARFYLSYCYSCAILLFLFFCNFFTVSGVVIPFLLAFIIDGLTYFRYEHLHI